MRYFLLFWLFCCCVVIEVSTESSQTVSADTVYENKNNDNTESLYTTSDGQSPLDEIDSTSGKDDNTRPIPSDGEEISTSTETIDKSEHSSLSTRPRLITKEELASKTGKEEDKTMWLAMMSEVFDVTASPHFYAENATYDIFVGRDANVPFVTGIFTVEEAEKPILTLSPRQLYSLEDFLNSTYREQSEKYPFVGLLIGDLYDSSGNPTETLLEVRKKISEEKVVIEEYERSVAEIHAQWDREDEEKRKKEEYRKKRGPLQTIKDFFRGEL